MKKKIFKTKLTGRKRTVAMNAGRHAARNGWKRKSPFPNTRSGEAWLEGYDEETQNPSTLKHCTDCGHMFSTDTETCPTCDSTNIRSNVGVGTPIIMSVQIQELLEE